MLKGDTSNGTVVPSGPLRMGFDYPGHDLQACGGQGCPLPAGSTFKGELHLMSDQLVLWDPPTPHHTTPHSQLTISSRQYATLSLSDCCDPPVSPFSFSLSRDRL